MIEGDSVKIERARVKRRALNKKRGPKLWRWRVARLKRVKFRKRSHWSRTRWARYHDERDAKRCAWRRPYLKAIRLTWRPLPEAVASRAARIRERHNQRRAR